MIQRHSSTENAGQVLGVTIGSLIRAKNLGVGRPSSAILRLVRDQSIAALDLKKFSEVAGQTNVSTAALLGRCDKAIKQNNPPLCFELAMQARNRNAIDDSFKLLELACLGGKHVQSCESGIHYHLSHFRPGPPMLFANQGCKLNSLFSCWTLYKYTPQKELMTLVTKLCDEDENIESCAFSLPKKIVDGLLTIQEAEEQWRQYCHRRSGFACARLANFIKNKKMRTRLNQGFTFLRVTRSV
ncbi:MAG: hypothetical protein WCH11_04045 [Bdellovibrio sp.]